MAPLAQTLLVVALLALLLSAPPVALLAVALLAVAPTHAVVVALLLLAVAPPVAAQLMPSCGWTMHQNGAALLNQILNQDLGVGVEWKGQIDFENGIAGGKSLLC